MTLTLTPVDECDLCHRLPAEASVECEGRIVGVCGSCWERIEDEEGNDDA